MANVPVSPGVLYPQPAVQSDVLSYPFTYDVVNRNVDGHHLTNVVTTSNESGGWSRGEFPAQGGQAPFQLPREKTMREPRTDGTQVSANYRAY